MENQQYHVLGIMSGTSLDGIDLAELRFKKEEAWSYEILSAETKPYPEAWKRWLATAVSLEKEELESLNSEYTRYLAKVIREFISAENITDLDAVCSHGHTIKHEPQNGFTLQIGNLPELAALIDQRVVCDFRVEDVKLGGQGAPLVPIGDELLFSEYDFCLNLGGFANISTEREGQRVAYDICPVNTVMNALAEKLGKAYDENGSIAAEGSLDEELLQALNGLEFYQQAPPKSLGIEWVNENIFPKLEGRTDIPDLLHTYAVHAGMQISRNLQAQRRARVLVTGGGAFNGFLMDQIASGTGTEVLIPPREVVDYKEALIFGFLGVLKLRGENNTLGSVTGASKDHSAGFVYEP